VPSQGTPPESQLPRLLRPNIMIPRLEFFEALRDRRFFFDVHVTPVEGYSSDGEITLGVGSDLDRVEGSK